SSSLSVYADYHAVGLDETAPVATLTSAQVHQAHALDTSGQVSAATYGNMYGAPSKPYVNRPRRMSCRGVCCAFVPDSSSGHTTTRIALRTGPCAWRVA